ncbi:beta-1,3-glucan-binding protein-like isoform X2 [Lycorma delicatula]|uniref:beta-1,3-glucan-binding protein-like isoform X2 n=1 Tax=Lycorma delicatula TaxID=130591 RepID=UPI003F50F5C6
MFWGRIIIVLFTTTMQLEMGLAQYIVTPAQRAMINGDKECAEDSKVDLNEKEDWISYAASADNLFQLGCEIACLYEMMGILKNNRLQKQRLSTVWHLLKARSEDPKNIDGQVNVMTECVNALGDGENRCNTGIKVLLCGFISKVKSKSPTANYLTCPDGHIYVNSKTTCIGKTLFEDNFNEFDNQKWRNTIKISSQEDEEFVVYTNKKENFYFSDGKLYIRPTLMNDSAVTSGSLNLKNCTGYYGSAECKRTAESYNILPPVFSAQITSKMSFKYGIIEIRAKLPQGDWIIPQIYLEPKNKEYGPIFNSGRMVIIKNNGNKQLTTDSGEDISSKKLKAGIVMGVDYNIKNDFSTQSVPNYWQNDFHNFTLIWKPGTSAKSTNSILNCY